MNVHSGWFATGAVLAGQDRKRLTRELEDAVRALFTPLAEGPEPPSGPLPDPAQAGLIRAIFDKAGTGRSSTRGLGWWRRCGAGPARP